MKIAIVGSRGFRDYRLLAHTLEPYFSQDLEIVSGGAAGADTLAENYAENRDLSCTIFKPNWKRNGKLAGFKRNQQIVDIADMIIAFWDGSSRGTVDTIEKAKRAKKPTLIVYY